MKEECLKLTDIPPNLKKLIESDSELIILTKIIVKRVVIKTILFF